MTDRQSQSRFLSLSDVDQKRVRQRANEIRRFGANHFWVETGCHADNPKCEWLLIAFAMLDLNFISSLEFYGVH